MNNIRETIRLKTIEHVKQDANKLADFLKDRMGMDFNVVLGGTGENYTVQGPFGTMLFWLSPKEASVVYMVDIMADAPSVLEAILALMEAGFPLVYSGAYTTDPASNNAYVFGVDAYKHKETWLRRVMHDLNPIIIT